MFGAILDEIMGEGRNRITSLREGFDRDAKEENEPSKIWSSFKTQTLTSLKSPAVVVDVDMFHRFNYLMNELHGDARDDSLCFSESTLQCA